VIGVWEPAPALLPCPFCGHPGPYVEHGPDTRAERLQHQYWVECYECGAHGGRCGPGASAPERWAVEAWNRRTPL
jgi:Lar family restriction alleviation protein